jgi:hypothetical protein
MKTSQKYLGLFLFAAIAVYATIVFAGAPLKGIDIKLGKNPGGSPEAKYTATTDGDGKFTISNLAAGTYDLYCSYAACAKAINTKGTGAVAKATLPSRFSIEIDGISNLKISSATPKSTSIPALDGASKEGAYKAEITQDWGPTKPGLTIVVSGKTRELTGHVMLIK